MNQNGCAAKLVYYNFAINVWDDFIAKNPDSYHAYHIRGFCKLKKAMEELDPLLAESGYADIVHSVKLSVAQGKRHEHEYADDAMKWPKG